MFVRWGGQCVSVRKEYWGYWAGNRFRIRKETDGKNERICRKEEDRREWWRSEIRMRDKTLQKNGGKGKLE